MPSRQSFFWRIFMLFAILQLGTLIAFVVLSSRWLESMVIDAEERRLRDSVVILRDYLRPAFEAGDTNAMTAISKRIASETGARITVVAKDGEVLADSDNDPQSMANHRDRPELIQAAAKSTGTARRYSDTIKTPMLYFAVRLDATTISSQDPPDSTDPPDSVDTPSGVLGFIRCALPLSELQAKATQLKRTLWLVATGFSIACLLVTYLLTRRALEPVRTLTAAAQSLAKGEYHKSVDVSRQDELGRLASSFNDMSSGIEARERQLRESSERMAAVLSGMVEAVIAVDTEKRVMFANEAAGDIFDIDTEKIQGVKLRNALSSRAFNRILKASFKTNADESALQYVEIEAKNKSILSVNAARLPGDPCPGTVLVMHDITELRRLEKLRQEFVANVSHELKTPLSAILAYAETLDNGALEDPDNSRRFVKRIEEQAHRLSDLIQDMLQLARIEAGQVLYEVDSVKLFDVVDKCVQSHKDKADSRNIELIVQEDEKDLVVQGNSEALRQILDNLVDNGLKYTPHGGSVRIGWTREANFVMLQVEDTGIGIPTEHHERIFERFYRVDKARSREMGGTGLGLSIVKHLAQTLGGSVTLESEAGAGTKFRVWLPTA